MPSEPVEINDPECDIRPARRRLIALGDPSRALYTPPSPRERYQARGRTRRTRFVQDYQPGETYTYLIGAEGSDLVKIGYAKDPDKRVMFLQTGSPMRLSILWAERGSYEAALHAEFREVLAHGEWFNLTALGDPVVLVTEAVARIKAAQ